MLIPQYSIQVLELHDTPSIYSSVHHHPHIQHFFPLPPHHRWPPLLFIPHIPQARLPFLTSTATNPQLANLTSSSSLPVSSSPLPSSACGSLQDNWLEAEPWCATIGKSNCRFPKTEVEVDATGWMLIPCSTSSFPFLLLLLTTFEVLYESKRNWSKNLFLTVWQTTQPVQTEAHCLAGGDIWKEVLLPWKDGRTVLQNRHRDQALLRHNSLPFSIKTQRSSLQTNHHNLAMLAAYKNLLRQISQRSKRDFKWHTGNVIIVGKTRKHEIQSWALFKSLTSDIKWNCMFNNHHKFEME